MKAPRIMIESGHAKKDLEVSRLLGITLKLATDDNAAALQQTPLALIINTLGAALDQHQQKDPDLMMTSLVSALAWIVRQHSLEVADELRTVAREEWLQ